LITASFTSRSFAAGTALGGSFSTGTQGGDVRPRTLCLHPVAGRVV
jgi:hypothetical protein